MKLFIKIVAFILSPILIPILFLGAAFIGFFTGLWENVSDQVDILFEKKK